MAKLIDIGRVAIGKGKSRTTISCKQWFDSLSKAFLPSGYWPRSDNISPANNNSKKKGFVLMDDWSRFSFLRSLCVYIIKTIKFYPFKKTLPYTAFVVRTESGKTLALIDTPSTGNALYVFDATTDNWISIAQLTKWQVLTGSHPEFIKRIYHNGSNWQQRVVDLLTAI